MLARSAALLLARLTEHTVTVTVGLHIDDASAEAITVLEQNFKELLEQVRLLDHCVIIGMVVFTTGLQI